MSGAERMVERPIPFSAQMVRALLAGTKKQTRRIYKARNGGIWPNLNDLPGMQQIMRNCPYGRPGDRLWVRETFAKIDGQTQPWIETDYRATYQHGDRLGDTLGIKKRWTPSIHMPRAASRITLELTDVRLERLQDISEADAQAEGARSWAAEQDTPVRDLEEARLQFRALWTALNGGESWDANPWVWVLEFEVAPCHRP